MMEKIDGKDLFQALYPNFLEQESIRSLPPDWVYDEQVLDLRTWSPGPDLPCPEQISFGIWQGDLETIHRSVSQVIPEWVPLYKPSGRVFCATDRGEIASFCLLEEMGEYRGLRVAGPGCVGTVPAYRKMGIGLRMIQLATDILRREGFDLSYIHYTGVPNWYARLGYQTSVRWNSRGII